MTAFSDLPPEIVAVILQAVEGPPGNKLLAAQLRTSRIFYECLKPVLYAKPCEYLLQYPQRTRAFRAAFGSNPNLLSLVTTWMLPFGEPDIGYCSGAPRRTHRWFARLSKCTELELAIHTVLLPPTSQQAAMLGGITDLTLSTRMPRQEHFRIQDITMEHLEKWTKHMPRLAGFFVHPLDQLPLEGLLYLPKTLVRLELLCDTASARICTIVLFWILKGLPLLEHFLLAELHHLSSVTATAEKLRDYMSPRVTSFGIGFKSCVEDDQVVERKLTWQRDIALLLERPYKSLTFYLVCCFMDFIDTLADSPNGRLVSNLSFKTHIRPYPLEAREDRASALASMYKLLDRSFFPNLVRLKGSRVKKQMEVLEDWEAFLEEAARVGVEIYVEE